jgi:hypothetical protein
VSSTKNKFRLFTFAGALFVSALVVGLLVYNYRCVGKVLDSYRDVPVYDNGLLFFRSHGKNYAPDGYYYGQKWQCVEFIKRFYHDAKHHKMPDAMGHAKSFFDMVVSDGALNTRRGLIQYRNGSTERPRPDDLMVFADTRFGHVGIVTEVRESTVEIIQQNILGHTRQHLSLTLSNGHYFITTPRTPAGWLRVPTPP